MRYLQVFMNKIYRLYYVFIYTFYIELMKKKKKKSIQTPIFKLLFGGNESMTRIKPAALSPRRIFEAYRIPQRRLGVPIAPSRKRTRPYLSVPCTVSRRLTFLKFNHRHY